MADICLTKRLEEFHPDRAVDTDRFGMPGRRNQRLFVNLADQASNSNAVLRPEAAAAAIWSK